MKYYAVTDDPRELYHYGVKGMKWGQHIFGDKPKSPAYKNAVKKLKAAKTNVVSNASKSVKTVTPKIKKTATQAAYNIRAKQQDRFEKSVAKAQSRLDKSNTKFDNYQVDSAQKAVQKQVAKVAKAIKRQENRAIRKENFNNAITSVQKTANQLVQNKRNAEQNRFNKAVEKAQKRNDLFDTLRGLDQEDKLYKQADRERKMDALREKHADIMADNDLKSMRKAVKVEKNMPKYYQEARTGMLPYGKLSDEQIGRLQNRLALEASTRRLGSTEAPSWRQQKKAARREGYLQGITKGISAGMEEVGRASVQYGIKNLANRRKLDNASEQKAQREKTANRIKSKKTHSEMREDLKDQAYEAQIKEGVHAVQRGAVSARQAARQLRYAENRQRERQDAINDAREERKFLMEESQNSRRDERQRQQRLAETERTADEIGKQLYEHGYAIIPQFNKDGKKTGMKVLTRDGGGKDNKGNDLNEGRAYFTLYKSKYKLADPSEKDAPSAKTSLDSETERALAGARIADGIRRDFENKGTNEKIDNMVNEQNAKPINERKTTDELIRELHRDESARRSQEFFERKDARNRFSDDNVLSIAKSLNSSKSDNDQEQKHVPTRQEMINDAARRSQEFFKNHDEVEQRKAEKQIKKTNKKVTPYYYEDDNGFVREGRITRGIVVPPPSPFSKRRRRKGG